MAASDSMPKPKAPVPAPPLLRGVRGVVVGVSSENSLGYHCARRARALGAEVAVTHRASRRATIAPLAEREGLLPRVELDADDEDSIARAFAAIGAAWGRVDFIVHTLVHVPDGLLARPLLELSRADFDQVMGVSAHSLVSVARHALPWLMRSQSPRIVALTSASAARATPNYHVAGIAKAALGAAVVYLAHELGPRGILCNAVSASLLATDGAVRAVGAQNAAATRAVLARKCATRTPVTFDDVADTVSWLCSPLARNTTGETLTVDGGYASGYF